MSVSVDIVIGANFGDEGKGLVTNKLCEKLYFVPTLNIRYCSGSQAGHTAISNGKHHVFHHFGAGSLQGADTYLSRFFILNPLTFYNEVSEFINKFKFIPKIFVSDDSIISCPYDIMRNQLVEAIRYDKNHGSVGVGIFETIYRNRTPELAFTLGELRQSINNPTSNFYKRKLKLIAENWRDWYNQYIPIAVKNGIQIPSELYKISQENMDDVVQRRYFEYCEFFLKHTISDKMLTAYSRYVFEGAQGLGLCQEISKENFPYLTPANTGSLNVAELLYEIPYLKDAEKDITRHYVTRSYFTRHGKGPFAQLQKNEIPIGWNIVEETNSYHEYQQDFKIGYFNVADFESRIMKDIHSTYIKAKNIIELNFIDQTNNMLYYTLNESKPTVYTATEDIIPYVFQHIAHISKVVLNSTKRKSYEV